MLKICVLGAGHLGKIHIKLLKEIGAYDLIGFYDPDDVNSGKVVEEFGIKRYNDAMTLIEASDVVDIVTPTLSHFEYASQAMKKGKHLFIEKPLTNTLEEAESLLKISEEINTAVQVGHVERYNPAFLSVKDKLDVPAFIESHRLAAFNPRGTDVSVVLDLMIHDLDIILSLVKANPKRVSANGVAIISDSPDIANARVEFDNGSVANITASRLSVKNMRKMRLFQSDAYVSIDFLEKKAELIRLTEQAPEGKPSLEVNTGDKFDSKFISMEETPVEQVNSIKMELEALARSIENNEETEVSLMDGYKALKLAYQIIDKINKNN